jgi:hypothetical protein
MLLPSDSRQETQRHGVLLDRTTWYTVGFVTSFGTSARVNAIKRIMEAPYESLLSWVKPRPERLCERRHPGRGDRGLSHDDRTRRHRGRLDS